MSREILTRQFESNLLSAGVLESDVHREFVSGLHGFKLEFDMVNNHRTAGLYLSSLALKTAVLKELVSDMESIAVVGIANGTLQHARDWVSVLKSTAARSQKFTALDTTVTRNKEGKCISLSEESRKQLVHQHFDLVVLDDDVGSTGSTTAQPVPVLREFGVEQIVAFYDWIRRENLPFLDQLGVQYTALVHKVLPSYEPADCIKRGFCADGLPLKRYGE